MQKGGQRGHWHQSGLKRYALTHGLAVTRHTLDHVVTHGVFLLPTMVPFLPVAHVLSLQTATPCLRPPLLTGCSTVLALRSQSLLLSLFLPAGNLITSTCLEIDSSLLYS